MGAKLTQAGNMEAHGSIAISGSAELSASTSMTEAIVSVTSNSMRAEIELFWGELERTEPATISLLAEGKVTPKDLAIKTSLTPEVTKHMATVKHQTSELDERREHEKAVARIGARGPMWAEIVKYALPAVGVLLLWLIFG